MYTSKRFTALLLLLVLLLATYAQAQHTVIYVESNIGQVANMNSVYAWVNDGAGHLSALSGSPFLTGGTGNYVPQKAVATVFQADQEVVINPLNKTLLTVNGHTNTITVMKIQADGSLAPISGSPFASNGQDPVSLGLDLTSPGGAVLTVVNQSEDPTQHGVQPNYTTFKVSPSGQLTPVTGSTIQLRSHSKPSQALVSPSGQFVFTDQFLGGGKITAWRVRPTGLLKSANVVGPPTGDVFLGLAVNPLFDTLYAGLPDVNEIAIYTYDSTGKLTFANTSSNSGLEVCWLVVNAEATRLYSANTIDNSVSTYDISGNNLTPVEMQHLTLATNAGGATNLAVDPNGAFLYVLGAALPGFSLPGNAVHVLAINTDGTLSENTTPVVIPVPSGESPQGLAVYQTP